MKRNKENYFTYSIAHNTRSTGFFRIYQSRNGAIQLAMGNVVTEFTQKQINELGIDVYTLQEDFSIDDYLKHYNT